MSGSRIKTRSSSADGIINSTVGQSKVQVGRYTYGHDSIKILQWRERAQLRIGAFCSIASGSIIYLGGNHRVDWATTFPFGHIFKRELGGTEIKGHPQSSGDVIIGNDVWLAQNVTIMSGVTIADGAVVATNSTVAKDVGAYEIWGGNPAKFIKKRFDDEIIEELLRLKWWDLPENKIKEIAPILSTPPDPEMIARLKAAIGD